MRNTIASIRRIISKPFSVFVALVLFIILIVWADLNYNITGYGYLADQLTLEEAVARRKNVWDWLDLLIIPAVLAGGAFFFNRAERDNDRKITEERTAEERRIANDRAEAIVLQSYLDRMSELLIDKELRNSDPDSEKRLIARSWTITTLKQLSSERNATLISFLQESGLLIVSDNTCIITLEEANLTGGSPEGS